MYGRHNPALGGQAQLQIRGFAESYAKVGWGPAGQGQVGLHPVFATNANLARSLYRISRPAAELPVLYLAAYQSAAELGKMPVPFAKTLLYSFSLPKAYNDYQLLYRVEASKPAEKYIGQLQDGKLTLYNNSTDPQQRGRPSKFGVRRPLAASDLQEMKELLAEVKQPLPAQYTPEVAGEPSVTYVRVVGTSSPLQESSVHLLKPLFGTGSN